MPQLYQMTHIT